MTDTIVLDTTRPLAGMSRFIRYAFMPNRLRYCGGDDNRTLFEYGIEQVTGGGLPTLLRKFTGAYPYLQLIARANAIPDPFDERVVEAYWIGNDLLAGVEVRQLHDALAERVVRQVEGRGFADAALPGDWVSVHWSWVCKVLSDRQQANLARYTDDHLRLANQTV